MGRFGQEDPHWTLENMLYGDEVNRANERSEDDPMGLRQYVYTSNINAIAQSGNLYVYGINNPLLYQDPSGEWAFVVPAASALGEAATSAAVTAGFITQASHAVKEIGKVDAKTLGFAAGACNTTKSRGDVEGLVNQAKTTEKPNANQKEKRRCGKI